MQVHDLCRCGWTVECLKSRMLLSVMAFLDMGVLSSVRACHLHSERAISGAFLDFVMGLYGRRIVNARKYDYDSDQPVSRVCVIQGFVNAYRTDAYRFINHMGIVSILSGLGNWQNCSITKNFIARMDLWESLRSDASLRADNVLFLDSGICHDEHENARAQNKMIEDIKRNAVIVFIMGCIAESTGIYKIFRHVLYEFDSYNPDPSMHGDCYKFLVLRKS